MSDSFSGRLKSCQMRWYVVSTKPNREKQAEQNIQHIGMECFLPLLQEEKIVRRKIRTVIAPLFPGYLFVRFNLLEHHRTVTYTRGVRKIVEFGSSHAEVDNTMIDAIKSRMAHSRVCMLERSKELRSGQLVQIKDGPLVGLEAVFMRKIPGKQRAMVLFHTLSLQARAVINIHQLAPCVAA